MKKKATILIYLIAFLVWSPWAMAVFNRSKPASSTSMRNSNPEILANWSGLEDGIDREHSFSTGGTVAAQGEHTPGSGKAFSQASAPATQVDGGAFAATDLGSLWVDTDDNAFYVLTATTPTWTPVSTEVIAILLASNRVFAGTLGVTGDFDVNTNKFTVAAASGNTAVAGTLDITGATELIGIATIADQSVTKTTAAPSADAQIANKKYVDDQVPDVGGDDPVTTDSESQTMVKAHAYLAQTTGFVTAWSNTASVSAIKGYVGTTNDPAGAGTQVGENGSGNSIKSFVSFFVANGNFFELTHAAADVNITWTPLIVGGAAPIDQD